MLFKLLFTFTSISECFISLNWLWFNFISLVLPLFHFFCRVLYKECSSFCLMIYIVTGSPTQSLQHPLSGASPMPSPAHAIIPESNRSSISEDPFSISLKMSDTDRCHDAWLPSEATRQVLVAMVTSPPGTYIPEESQLTMPGIVIDEPQVKSLVTSYYSCVFLHDNSKCNRSRSMKLEYIVVYENISDNGHCQIKAKFKVGL